MMSCSSARPSGTTELQGVADMISIPSSLMQDVIAENSVAVLPVYMSADNDAFYNKFWQPMYNISNRSNTVLEKLASAPAADRARIEGEAKFFRGFAYFNLARAFGTVPLILESYKFSTPPAAGEALPSAASTPTRLIRPTSDAKNW